LLLLLLFCCIAVVLLFLAGGIFVGIAVCIVEMLILVFGHPPNPASTHDLFLPRPLGRMLDDGRLQEHCQQGHGLCHKHWS